MAHTLSPRASPHTQSHGRRGQTRSPSPQPFPQSKRDKRRTMLSEKLSDMVASFSNNHFEHYYAQLSAIQCDINLVMRADPYRDGPLDDSREEIERAIADARQEICRSRNIAPDAESSFAALSGHFYSRFANDVNTAMEERDRDLSLLYNQYHEGLEELRRTDQYKRQLAHEEHALLSKTLRERLIQTVTQKRTRLLRDKEQLDIADSNALLLNPTQFSIGNPASPGGAHSNRKTRHTRGRPGDVGDETSSGPVENGKRKRKAAIEETDAGSPGPSARGPDNGNPAVPFRDMRARLTHAQFEAPLYSVERLFTEKELALNLNRAHLQTSEYFAKIRAQGLENRLHAAANGLNGASASVPTSADAELAAENAAAVTDALANAPAGEVDALEGDDGHSPSPTRQPQYHATRAAQRNNPLADLANTATNLASLPAGMPTAMAMGNMMPPFSVNLSTSAGKSNATAPSLGGLVDTDAANDLVLIREGPNHPDYQRLVHASVQKHGAESSVGSGVLRDDIHPAGQEASNGLDALGAAAEVQTPSIGRAAGGVPMSKASSVQGSDLGGTAMKRTTSAADFGGRGRR